MKPQIDIITGFLGAGKTTFINGLLQSEPLAKERIVVIQCETGEEEIDSEPLNNPNIHVEKLDGEKSIDTIGMKEIIKKYSPDRILIEHNGMSKVEELLDTLEDRKLRKYCSVNMVFHLVDASTFDVYMNNMGSILVEQISNSGLIIINNMENLSRHKINNIQKTLTAINKSASIVSISSPEEFRLAADHGAIYSEKVKVLSKPSDKLLLVLFALIVPYFLYTVFRSMDLSNMDFSGLQVLNTVFLSILIQAFPFIFIGVFVSAIIQVFVSSETITKLFPRKMGLGFISAIVAGFFFPVCDCAIVPVAARLIKKGVPLPTAVTFMLAAPIVNPIVIASTFYAFPGQPSIALYRLYAGVTVAIAVGLTFWFFPESKSILRNGIDQYACQCGYCGENYNKKGILGKIDAIFRHAGAEFFQVGRFIIIGALLSSIVQVYVPKDIIANTSGGYAISLLIMMLSAFVLSVCSTSDAFIARTFVNQFSIGPVMGFMVLGPMVDIKNLLMMLGSFKKRFVIKLVLVVFGISFALLLFLTTMLFGR